ncbi:MAG: serine protease, partial [Azoarcus sp.]|nr:serine protease [Azoarcus sp.]
MKFPDFVVRILNDEGELCGTGFFLTDERIVTCTHVLQGRKKAMFSFADDSTKRFEANVCETLLPCDLSILSIDSTIPEQRRTSIPALAIASISGTGEMDVESFGYPLWDGSPPCVVRPKYTGTVACDGIELLQLDSANNITKGLSGAPVIAGENHLIGIIKRITDEDEHGRGHDIAYAIPADTLRESFPDKYDDTYQYHLDEPAFRNLKRQDFNGERLALFRFTERRTSFFWQAGVRQAFDAFYQSEAAFSWWLIVGGAGTGKSRTALEFCEDIKERGWRAGFLALDGKKPLDFWETWRPAQDTFLVVDYAYAARHQ